MGAVRQSSWYNFRGLFNGGQIGFIGRETKPMDLAVCILASLPINDTTAMKNKISFRSRTLRTQFSELKNDSPLSLMIYDTAEEWYKAKHPRFSFDEVALVNSLDGPHCGSSIFKRDGKRKDGIQNFRCNDSAGGNSTRFPGRCLTQGKYRYRNGSNSSSISSSTKAARSPLLTTETPNPRADIGLRRFSRS